MNDSSQLQAEILRLLEQRGPGKSICPSEVARTVCPENWREKMAAVREAAAQLEQQGELVATQKGIRVSLCDAKGPIRLRLP